MSVSIMVGKSGDNPATPDFQQMRDAVETRLGDMVPPGTGPAEAARHSLLAPGKRLRAILTMIAAEECGGDARSALDAACAVEMVHTASLVFDDLPAMDDAELRRGVKTPHVLYGVDVAILAGIGLLNGAFGAIAGSVSLNDAQKTKMTRILSDAVGWSGLVGGQALDLTSGQNAASLEEIHDGKTGVLFEAAVLCGAVVGDVFEKMEPGFRAYATSLGRAYQAFDDILDQVADDRLAGKSTARDDGKLTALTGKEGLEDALGSAAQHLDAAKLALPVPANQASPLRLFADSIYEHFKTTFAKAAG
ncbi:polyprenyl synthetase family protein [Parvularcula marina]|uniref:Polyprenyl synthetase family protein n=1 Tax=Parvularcula marina TaxID=2292771 RepID=A0A371RF16_9PROT|nr:polyprenyl synthetase family protein [Parvularcula marina]RFB04037.1 polyprenyl synthetase family protein [Parvularcula marina]